MVRVRIGHSPVFLYLCLGTDYVRDAEERQEGQHDRGEDDFLGDGECLQKAHFLPVPDARQMLLAVRMRHKLNVMSFGRLYSTSAKKHQM